MTLRVIGVGDNVADHYLHSKTIYPGGCALNFAVFAKQLGAESAYLGILGDDLPGIHILRTAQRLGIDVSRCRVLHGETPLPAVCIENGERTFVGMNSGGVWEKQLVLIKKDLDYIGGYDLIHTSIFSGMEQNVELLADTGVPVSMDLSDEFSESFFEFHCPKLTYAEMSCSHLSDQETLARISLVHQLGTPFVIATRGEHGAYFSDGSAPKFQPAEKVEAIDTMGAGDAFITAVLLKHVEDRRQSTLNGERIDAALTEASRFAAETVLIDGAFGHGSPYSVD